MKIFLPLILLMSMISPANAYYFADCKDLARFYVNYKRAINDFAHGFYKGYILGLVEGDQRYWAVKNYKDDEILHLVGSHAEEYVRSGKPSGLGSYLCLHEALIRLNESD